MSSESIGLHARDLPLRPTDYAPIHNWLEELRNRVEGWSQAVKGCSAVDWQRLKKAVSGAISTNRVEQVVSEFLGKIGVRGRKVELEDLYSDLTRRVVAHRREVSIENYPQFLSSPPRIHL